MTCSSDSYSLDHLNNTSLVSQVMKLLILQFPSVSCSEHNKEIFYSLILKMEAAGFVETLVPTCQTTRQYFY